MISFSISSASCPNDKLCGRCEDTRCFKCWEGILKDGECREPSPAIENCIEYLGSICSTCKVGYYFNFSDKECLEIGIPNCADAEKTPDLSCLTCDNGVYVKDNKCDSSNPRCPDNCASCVKGECKWCKSGYSLSETLSCVKEQTPNCKVADATSPGRCLICNPGYYDNNGICKSKTSTESNGNKKKKPSKPKTSNTPTASDDKSTSSNETTTANRIFMEFAFFNFLITL